MARVRWHGWASLSLACRVIHRGTKFIGVFVANNFVRLEAESVWLLLRRTPELHVGQRQRPRPLPLGYGEAMLTICPGAQLAKLAGNLFVPMLLWERD